MNIMELILLGVGLSMDAFAISVSAGINDPRMEKKNAIKMAAYFGGFQALMPVLGWLLGSSLSEFISAFDHWVAFGLLAFIGVKMIVDTLKGGDDGPKGGAFSHGTLLTMAVATSIDALAVGISLALVGASIPLAAAVIGITTFAICLVGAFSGKKLGGAFRKKAGVIGGAVLIAIGVKILLEHLLG